MDFKKLKWHEKIKVLRALKNISQDEAAGLCNTSKRGFFLWEHGKSFPRKNSRIAIAKAFEVTVEDIFDEVI